MLLKPVNSTRLTITAPQLVNLTLKQILNDVIIVTLLSVGHQNLLVFLNSITKLSLIYPFIVCTHTNTLTHLMHCDNILLPIIIPCLCHPPSSFYLLNHNLASTVQLHTHFLDSSETLLLIS